MTEPKYDMEDIHDRTLFLDDCYRLVVSSSLDIVPMGTKMITRAANLDPEQEIARLKIALLEREAEIGSLLEALELVLIFHNNRPWNEYAVRWLEITGHGDATTRILCDHIRAAIAKVEK